MRHISHADSDKIEEFINSMDANELLTLIDSFKLSIYNIIICNG